LEKAPSTSDFRQLSVAEMMSILGVYELNSRKITLKIADIDFAVGIPAAVCHHDQRFFAKVNGKVVPKWGKWISLGSVGGAVQMTDRADQTHTKR